MPLKIAENMIWIPLAISIGAILGALGRYYATLFWIEKRGNQFPCGTLFVNLTGAFLIGITSAIATQFEIPAGIQKMIMVGFLGSFTTFSTYILDTANLFGRSNIILGWAYWLGSPILGFVCVELGLWLGRQLG